MCQKRYMGDSPLIKGLNYNNPGDDVFADSGRQGHASIHAPKPCRPMNYNADSTGNEAMAKTKAHPRPAPIYAPRGGDMNYNHTGYGQNAQSTGTPSCVPTNYNRQLRHGISAKPNPWRRSQCHETAIRRNSAAQRITMLTAPTSKTSCPHPAPQQCAPRGGHRSKPRPKPRRHHLTHAADTGQT